MFFTEFWQGGSHICWAGAGIWRCGSSDGCDLQHPPETLIEMYRLWQQGYEVIEGIKKKRGKESLFYKLSAGIFTK